jgi:hypothetical protein
MAVQEKTVSGEKGELNGRFMRLNGGLSRGSEVREAFGR